MAADFKGKGTGTFSDKSNELHFIVRIDYKNDRVVRAFFYVIRVTKTRSFYQLVLLVIYIISMIKNVTELCRNFFMHFV